MRGKSARLLKLPRYGSGVLTALLLSGCGTAVAPTPAEQLRSGDAEVRRDAAEALGVLGNATDAETAALIAAAADAEPEVRQAACRALGRLPQAVAAARPVLHTALRDPELAVRLAAALALLKLDPTDELFVPVLNAAMRDGEGGTIVAVGQLGAQGTWALPTLVQLLRDRRPGIRRIAAEAIGRIGPDAAAAAALERAGSDADDRVREAAAAALNSGS